jgi:hypothetical protein
MHMVPRLAMYHTVLVSLAIFHYKTYRLSLLNKCMIMHDKPPRRPKRYGLIIEAHQHLVAGGGERQQQQKVGQCPIAPSTAGLDCENSIAFLTLVRK